MSPLHATNIFSDGLRAGGQSLFIWMRPSRCGLGSSTGRTSRYQPLPGAAFGSGKFVVPFPKASEQVELRLSNLNEQSRILGSEMSYDKYEYTLSQARCVNVFQSKATEEFLEARKDNTCYSWWEYKELCQLRHAWGIYLCSNLDWDWDTTRCLKRLFELPEEAIAPPAPIATVSLNGGNADTWNLSTEISLPKQMRVAYKSPTGETKYKTFISCPSSEDVVSTEAAVERKEADDRPGHGIYDAAPIPETKSELGVNQGSEKKNKVSLTPEKPNSGAVEVELNAVVDNGGFDPLREQETEEGVKVDGDGGVCSSENGFEELMTDFEEAQEQYTDEISIRSLD